MGSGMRMVPLSFRHRETGQSREEPEYFTVQRGGLRAMGPPQPTEITNTVNSKNEIFIVAFTQFINNLRKSAI